MTVLAPKYALTVEKYHRMIESGVFAEDDRVELIEGEMFERAPIGSRHAACVDALNRIFVRGSGDEVVVRVQNPVQLGDLSEPEPDVVVARAKAGGYRDRHPKADEILLLVEVSDSSHRYEEAVKLPLYARHGVREVWRIDLEAETVTVHRGPEGESYGSATTARPGDLVAPEALPELRVSVSGVLGA